MQGTIELTFPIMMVRQRRGPPSASPPSPSMLAPESEVEGVAADSNMTPPDAELRTIIETMAGSIAAMMDTALANRTPSSISSGNNSVSPAPPAGLGIGVDPHIPLAAPGPNPRGSPASAPLPMGRMSPGFAQIMAQLVGMHGGPAPQPPWAHNEWHRLMEMTMADTGGVKKVASEEGLDQVKRWTFKQEEDVGEDAESREGGESSPLTCAITQMPFENGDEVAEMPCGHKFDAESLTRWLQRESAQCPVCRYELPSREVACTPVNEDSDSDSDSSVEGPPDDPAPPAPVEDTDSEIPDVLRPLLPHGLPPGVQGVPAGLLLMGGPGGRGFLFTRQRLEDQALQQMAEIEQQIEDDQIEAAILASVLRESMNDQ